MFCNGKKHLCNDIPLIVCMWTMEDCVLLEIALLGMLDYFLVHIFVDYDSGNFVIGCMNFSFFFFLENLFCSVGSLRLVALNDRLRPLHSIVGWLVK